MKQVEKETEDSVSVFTLYYKVCEKGHFKVISIFSVSVSSDQVSDMLCFLGG